MDIAPLISTRVRSIQVSAIKQMSLLARNMKDVVSLGQGIPSVLTPKRIREGVTAFLMDDPDIGKYSLQPGMPKLREAVARNLSDTYGFPIDPESEILITAGAIEGLLVSIMTVVERGDEVILFDPCYASHIEQVKLAEGIPVFVPLRGQSEWSLDPDLLKKAITPRTKAILICSPSNPTGKVFSSEEMEMILTLAQKRDLFVIADETYAFLTYDGVPFWSALEYPTIRDRLIVCRSFSKEFAMTGWRVGYVYACREVIAELMKVHDATVICAPTISQYAALLALTLEPDPNEEPIARVLGRRRELLCKRLDGLSDLFAYSKPQGAYYVFVRCLKFGWDSWKFTLKLLHEAGVITIPGIAFGPQGEGHIRMSFGGTEDEINEAFDRIAPWSCTL